MGKAIFLGKNTNDNILVCCICIVHDVAGCDTAPCKQFGRLLLKFKKSKINADHELPAPVGRRTELEV